MRSPADRFRGLICGVGQRKRRHIEDAGCTCFLGGAVFLLPRFRFGSSCVRLDGALGNDCCDEALSLHIFFSLVVRLSRMTVLAEETKSLLLSHALWALLKAYRVVLFLWTRRRLALFWRKHTISSPSEYRSTLDAGTLRIGISEFHISSASGGYHNRSTHLIGRHES